LNGRRLLLPERLLAIAPMKQTTIGNRFIVIGGTAPAIQKIASRNPSTRLPRPQRIVLIKNGKLVGSKSAR
jgi:hypothetical protein